MPGKLVEIDPLNFNTDIFKLFARDWLLLTSGDFQAGSYNTMTIAWGSLGLMWSKPLAMVVLRKQRYTLEFIQKHDSFTLTVFPEQHRQALTLLGSKSGRDGDKIKAAGLTPVASQLVASPAFAEAELILECKKSYSGGMLDPNGFVDPQQRDTVYPQHDYHHVFFGEVVAIRGLEKYQGCRQ